MATGTVKWFNRAKGFGVINDNATGADVYVHFSMINDRPQTLTAKDVVSFEYKKTPRRVEAINVRK